MYGVVESQHVLDTFRRSSGAASLFARWQSNPKRAQVVPLVMAHKSQVVMQVPLDSIATVCKLTSHALGGIRKEDVAWLDEATNWTSPFAMTHVWHFIVEEIGEVPTWQQFLEQLKSPKYLPMLWEPLEFAVDSIQGLHPELHTSYVRQALMWRLGNAYYSFLREQYVHALLRDEGILFGQHPLADALFAADGWRRGTILNIYIGNEKFRQEERGRKRSAQVLLADAEPKFNFEDIEMEAATRHGKVHLPDAEELRKTARRLRKCLS